MIEKGQLRKEMEDLAAKNKLTVKTGHAIWAGDSVIVVEKVYDPKSGTIVISGNILFNLVAHPVETLVERLKDHATRNEVGIDNLKNGKIWV